MAKIKTVSYEINGSPVAVNFNCSPKGIFSVNLNFNMAEKLGLPQNLTSTSLDEIERTVSSAFIKYKDSMTSYKLKISVRLGIGGELKYLPDGSLHPKLSGYNNKFSLNSTMMDVSSVVGIDYKLIIEETRDGRVHLYNGKVKEASHEPRPFEVTVGDFVTDGTACIRSRDVLIDYSKEVYDNLESITSQLRKAATFLLEIVSSDDIQLLLGMTGLRALIEHK